MLVEFILSHSLLNIIHITFDVHIFMSPTKCRYAYEMSFLFCMRRFPSNTNNIFVDDNHSHILNYRGTLIRKFYFVNSHSTFNIYMYSVNIFKSLYIYKEKRIRALSLILKSNGMCLCIATLYINIDRPTWERQNFIMAAQHFSGK